jgi:hypothetical protein
MEGMSMVLAPNRKCYFMIDVAGARYLECQLLD